MRRGIRTGQSGRLSVGRQAEQLAPVDGRPATAIELQKRLGSRAFGALLQREVTRDPPGSWITQGARARAAAAEVESRLAEQTQHLKDLERVGEDLIAEDLGLSIRPGRREPAAAGT